jgi:hypothetical protein
MLWVDVLQVLADNDRRVHDTAIRMLHHRHSTFGVSLKQPARSALQVNVHGFIAENYGIDS